MNTYELCKAIRRRITTRAAEVFSYGSWSDDFATSQIREIPKSIIESDGFFQINPNTLTSSEMDELGFCRWSGDSPIRLIPLWLLPFLVDEFEAGCIDGGPVKQVRREEIDNDHRFGCIAYGINPTI